eukprot:COSAG05_NODE_3965_length_1747_cov_2.464199_2_plen_77_part_00
MFGFTQTSGYNTIAAIDKDVTVVCYDRQGWGGGASGLGFPPVFGPLGTWSNGRDAHAGCYQDIASIFCMRVNVEIS